MKKVYSVFLSDEKLINYLDTIPNKSRYFRELILKDMEKQPFTDEQLVYIRQMIDEKLKGHSSIKSEDDSQLEETTEAINNLLDGF